MGAGCRILLWGGLSLLSGVGCLILSKEYFNALRDLDKFQTNGQSGPLSVAHANRIARANYQNQVEKQQFYPVSGLITSYYHLYLDKNRYKMSHEDYKSLRQKENREQITNCQLPEVLKNANQRRTVLSDDLIVEVGTNKFKDYAPSRDQKFFSYRESDPHFQLLDDSAPSVENSMKVTAEWNKPNGFMTYNKRKSQKFKNKVYDNVKWIAQETAMLTFFGNLVYNVDTDEVELTNTLVFAGGGLDSIKNVLQEQYKQWRNLSFYLMGCGGLMLLYVGLCHWAEKRIERERAQARSYKIKLEEQKQKRLLHQQSINDQLLEQHAHECIVCMNKVKSAVMCPCGHMNYCEACYGQSRETNFANKCPSCNAEINQQQTFFLVKE